MFFGCVFLVTLKKKTLYCWPQTTYVSSLMELLSWFAVESKVFQLSVVEGASSLCLVERSQGVARAV